MKKIILLFIKFFDEEWKADAFLKGNLYCNKISYFKNVEDDEQRGDRHEAVSLWLQPKGQKIELTVNDSNGRFFRSIEITEKDLAAPTSMSFTHHERFHIFCMYAACITEFEEECNTEEEKQQLVERLNAELQVATECYKMGKYAVMIDRMKFLERVKTEFAKCGLAPFGRLVDYYDDQTFNGPIPYKDIIFNKQKKYSHQNEFRIAFDAKDVGDGPQTVNIGSIADFAVKVESSKINGMIRIGYTEKSGA